MLRSLLSSALLLCAPVVHAAAPPAEPPLRVLQEVVVSGQMPGPGLWKVSKDGHVMYVLGTLTPLPKRMEWNSLDVERRIHQSGVVLMPPSVAMRPKGAALGGLFLLPSLVSVRNNPGKETLEEVLPPADYARWLALKARYLGRDRGVEKRRPFIAANELRAAALDEHDLSERNLVGKVVEDTAKRAKVPVVDPTLVIELEDPRGAIKEFKASEIDDLDCFRRTLDQVEQDLGTLARRANAWALGDIAGLQALPYTDNARACTDVLMRTGLAEKRGLADLPARVREKWLAAAEKAIAEHPQSFAMLSMGLVTGPSGYLAALREKGYTVEAPVPVDAAPDDEEGEAGVAPADAAGEAGAGDAASGDQAAD